MEAATTVVARRPGPVVHYNLRCGWSLLHRRRLGRQRSGELRGGVGGRGREQQLLGVDVRAWLRRERLGWRAVHLHTGNQGRLALLL